MPPTTENWLRKLYVYSTNNNTSDDDKHDTLETRTVLTASFLKTPELKKWSMEQGNLWEKIARAHRLGLYLKNRDR